MDITLHYAGCAASVDWIWLLFGLLWGLGQLIQRSAKKQAQSLPPPYPDPHAPHGTEEHDTEEDLFEILTKTLEKESKIPPRPVAYPVKPQPVYPPVPTVRPPQIKRERIISVKNFSAVQPSLKSKPTRKSLNLKTPASPRTLLSLQDKQLFRNQSSQSMILFPRMPDMLPLNTKAHIPHPLTSSLRDAKGLRKAILQRELLDKPRALYPYS